MQQIKITLVLLREILEVTVLKIDLHHPLKKIIRNRNRVDNLISSYFLMIINDKNNPYNKQVSLAKVNHSTRNRHIINN